MYEKLKELYKLEGTTDYATIAENVDKHNETVNYEVELKISFADYESARAFIESAGITGFKQVIKEG